MGLWTMLSRAFGKKRQAKILVVGLDNSGKSTLIHHMKVGSSKKSRDKDVFEATPTVGFHVEEFSNRENNINFVVYDMSGQGKYRSLWEHYYTDVQAIIYVFDSTDRLRLCVVKDELDTILDNKELKNKRTPLLFFANKMDVAGSLSQADCAQELQLNKIKEHPWHISASNALTGAGVAEGIEWLCGSISTAEESQSRKK